MIFMNYPDSAECGHSRLKNFIHAPFCGEPGLPFRQVHRFVLRRPPQPLDEHAVPVPAPARGA